MPLQRKHHGTRYLQKYPAFLLCSFLSSAAGARDDRKFLTSLKTVAQNRPANFSAEIFHRPSARKKTADFLAKNRHQFKDASQKSGPAGQDDHFQGDSYLRIRADGFYLRGERAFSLGENHKAVGFFKQAVLYDPRSLRLPARLAEVYTALGLWAEAVAQYEALLKEAPALHSVRRRLAEIYALNDLTRPADEHYKILLSATPENFSLLFQYARFLAQSGKQLRALSVLKTARKKAPDRNQKTEVLLTESLIYDLLGFPHQQKSLLALARAEEPYREDLILKIARRYVRLGETARAVRLLKDYHSRNSHAVETVRALADLSTTLNQKSEARRWLLKLRELGELDFKRHFYLSALFSERGEDGRAAVLLQDLLIPSFSHRADSVRYLLGAVYEKRGAALSAFEEYGNIPSHSVYFARARIRQAQIRQNQGRDSQAMNLLKPVIFARGDGPRALLLYTQLLWKQRKKQQTLAVLTEGLKHFPQNRDLLFLRGICFSKTGNIPGALKDIERILANNSQDEEALRVLADLRPKKTI